MSVPPAAGPSRTLLLIEDDPDSIYLFRHAFRKLELEPTWEVRHAVDGHEAMKQILSGSPDAVVTDLKGLHISGSELIRWMRANGCLSRIPIFVFSNSEALADKTACYEAGADEYLSKKATPDELRDMIRRLVLRADSVPAEKA